MVMTLPFLWLTSTSPSMLTTLLIFAVTPPSADSTLVKLSSRYCLAQAEASLLTQCQLLGLWRTILSAVTRFLISGCEVGKRVTVGSERRVSKEGDEM